MSGHLKYKQWFKKYVRTFVAVGGPMLGAPQALVGAMSGTTFGLPITELEARGMSSSFSSAPLMFPVSGRFYDLIFSKK